MKFIGRQKELESIEHLHKKKSSSLAVISGRRRIGKSRLIQEFIKGKEAWTFTGLAPTFQTTPQDQIDTFSGQLTRNTGIPKLKTSDWAEIFWHLGNLAKEKKNLIIVLDEISWMGSKDRNFLGHLKSEWDRSFSQHPNLILILCGSVSSWIEKNILSSTGFLGRISLKLNLKELPLDDCNAFWGNSKKRVSAFEKLKILSVTGGVPKYLEEIIPSESAEKNIHTLCFSPEGLLYEEYVRIFSDLFDNRAPTFDKIVQLLADGMKNLDQFCAALQIKKSGNISNYLNELILAGFVTPINTWNLKTKKTSTLKHFRLSDNYLRFYLKYIEPNKGKRFKSKALEALPGWESMLGLQFENLVLNNLSKLCDILGIDEYENAGPFFQRRTKSHRGCQLDLLIQTKFRTLYICEIKFKQDEVRGNVVEEMEEKISRLVRPKGFSIRPVLIHVNGVCEKVIESELFDHIVNFSELLES